jgi:putative peptidoglycan lipid II flippase
VSAAGAGSRLGTGLARAALGIAGVTVAARIVGFARTVVLARTVGPSCLGDTYLTANTVPNIVFEIVAGGALASLVVPVLAADVAAGDTAAARRTASALLSWVVLVLTPLAIAAAVLARPLMSVLVGDQPGAGCPRPAQVALGARMLVVFAPQIVLYGVGIVLTGVLQAHRRFLGPALAPLLSSLVVIAAYLTYAATTGARTELASLARGPELILSVGTTLGVAALSLPLLVPLRGTGIRLAPTLSFPPGTAARVRRLAAAGIAALAAQQLSVAVGLRLANGGPSGTVLVYTVATTVFLLPWAVLAVPIATSAYPTLAGQAGRGDEPGYAATTAATLRAVILVSAAAAAVLTAVAAPAARVLVAGAPGRPSAAALAATVVVFAPGLIGYGVLALLTRALYARGDGRSPAVAAVTGWLSVAVVDVTLAAALPRSARAVALGAGNSVGMTIAGLLLVRALRRAAGDVGIAGATRAAVAGGAGAGGGALAGAWVAGALGRALGSGVGAALVAGVGAAAVALGVVGLAVVLADRPDARALRAIRRG